MTSMKWTLLVLSVVQIVLVSCGVVDSDSLECRKKLYTYRVVQSDEQGRQCWDTLSVMSCWGRCDSNEISDWRFPFKRSYHPVCIHSGRTRSVARLRHCEPGVSPGTDRHVYLEASDCRCQACSSTNTSCEGISFRPFNGGDGLPLLGGDEGFIDDNGI